MKPFSTKSVSFSSFTLEHFFSSSLLPPLLFASTIQIAHSHTHHFPRQLRPFGLAILSIGWAAREGKVEEKTVFLSTLCSMLTVVYVCVCAVCVSTRRILLAHLLHLPHSFSLLQKKRRQFCVRQTFIPIFSADYFVATWLLFFYLCREVGKLWGSRSIFSSVSCSQSSHSLHSSHLSSSRRFPLALEKVFLSPVLYLSKSIQAKSWRRA